MSRKLPQILRRRLGSLVIGVAGLWFLIAAAGPHIDGIRTHIEYTQNVLFFVAFSIVCVAFACGLLFAAWRFWKAAK